MVEVRGNITRSYSLLLSVIDDTGEFITTTDRTYSLVSARYHQHRSIAATAHLRGSTWDTDGGLPRL